MNEQQEKCFSRFIGRLVELKIITINVKEVTVTADVAATNGKEPQDDTPCRNLRQG